MRLPVVLNTAVAVKDRRWLDGFRELDGRRRELLGEAETLKAERNQVSALIGKTKDKSQVQGEIARMKEVSARIKALDEELRQVEENLNDFLLTLPNLPDPACPVGASEADNPELSRWGTPREFGFEPKAHWDLGEALDIIDFERATKITGARFALSKGAGARLERALINFMLDNHTAGEKYTEMLPPFMVNRDAMTGTGQLPKFEADLFHLDDPDYFLIPTAEVPVTNVFREEILDGALLPVCYAAYTPCFRREAGAHGRDTRGLIRQHQFLPQDTDVAYPVPVQQSKRRRGTRQRQQQGGQLRVFHPAVLEALQRIDQLPLVAGLVRRRVVFQLHGDVVNGDHHGDGAENAEHVGPVGESKLVHVPSPMRRKGSGSTPSGRSPQNTPIQILFIDNTVRKPAISAAASPSSARCRSSI